MLTKHKEIIFNTKYFGDIKSNKLLNLLLKQRINLTKEEVEGFKQFFGICEDCLKEKYVSYRFNSYLYEIGQDETKFVLCQDCCDINGGCI